MSAKGFYSAQEGHWVPLTYPVDFTGGKTSPAVSLKLWDHASIFLAIGISAAAATKITVNACTDYTGANPVAIPFDLFAGETTNVDQLGPRLPQTAAGYTPSANDEIYYVIELDAEQVAQVGAGYAYFQLVVTNGANSVIASAVALLSKGRYGQDQSATVQGATS
jgi:hypothetical protein